MHLVYVLGVFCLGGVEFVSSVLVLALDFDLTIKVKVGMVSSLLRESQLSVQKRLR